MNRKILVVVDVSNIYYLFKRLYRGRLDYSKLLDLISEKGDIYRAIAYGADYSGESRGFRQMLTDCGFEIKYKPIKVYNNVVDGENRQHRKADWDVGIAMDVVTILDNVDTVAYVTGDGDMLPCLQYVKARGKLNYVYGCKISGDLRNFADHCAELGESLMENTTLTGV